MIDPKAARRKTRTLMRRVAEHDPVPCNGCTACCRDHQAVAYQDGDDVTLFTALGRLGENWVSILPQKGNGDCVYLGEEGCTVYERRPLVCRSFDCRRHAASFTPEQQVQAMMENGVYSLAVFAAGRERLPTMKLLPEEEGLWNGERFVDTLMARSKR